MELYILSQDDKILSTLTESTGLVSTWFKDHLNRVPDEPFIFTVEADTEAAEFVEEENQVVFRDKEGDLRLYVIKEIDDVDNVDGPETTATCEPAFMELKEHIIEDRRFVNQTANNALTAALQGTRWTGSVEVELGLATTNLYFLPSVDGIWKILEVWGGDFKDTVTFDGNQIISRNIKLLQRLGVDRGHRYEIDHNIEEIQRTVLSYPVTALYGRGASLQIEDEAGEATGGYSRYIDFANVEWKKSNGDPVDKPLGQKWIGDPEALQKYGRLHEGQLLHRTGIFSNQDFEDPAELLLATWHQLQKAKKPEVNYKLSVHLLESIAGYEHERASLGDTSRVIDRQFRKPIEIQARIIAIEYDLMDIAGTAVVEMGQFLSAYDYDDRLDNIIGTINDNRGKWEKEPVIENGNFPDIKPETPANFQAISAFQTIQLYWDFNAEVYVSHYELYGSQVQGFLPDSQHLLYRGSLNGFNHLVETDEVWYYRVRAVNTRGTPSDYSGEATGFTARIISDDILFGEEIAAELRELSKSAQLIASGTQGIDILKEGAMVGDIFLTDGRTYISDAAVGTAAIANAAITRAHLQDAIIGTAQIEDATITTAKVKDLSADKITTGTLHAIDLYSVVIEASELTAVDIYGSTIESRENINGHENFIRMTNNILQSHGRYTRTWAGVEETAIINLGVRRGQMWISNEENGYNLYFTERGLSTSMAGAIDQFTSGTLEFHSQRFNENSRGVTLHSSFGTVALVSDFSTVVTRSQLTNNIESQTSGIYMRPMREISAGVNEFRFDVKLNDSAFDSDGVIGYADFTGANSVGSAIRFAKNGDRIYATNRNGDIGTGDFQARNFYGNDFIGSLKAPATHAYAMTAYDGALRVTDKMGYNGGNVNYRDVQAKDILAQSIRLNVADGEDFYIGVSVNELRVTNNLRYNGGDTGYKSVRASGFIEASSEEYKEDITAWNYDALSVIMHEVQIYQYKFKGDVENLYRRGLIVERETPSEFIAGKGISTYEMNTWALRAIQQLGGEVVVLKLAEVEGREKIWFQLDDHETRIKKLEAEIEQLKAA